LFYLSVRAISVHRQLEVNMSWARGNKLDRLKIQWDLLETEYQRTLLCENFKENLPIRLARAKAAKKAYLDYKRYLKRTREEYETVR
jgi:hypothetical protein